MKFRIEADWENLESGPPEEQACFASIGIRLDDLWLTKSADDFVGRIRDKPYLSAYKLAEWLAWNWWRLRWEPRNSRRNQNDWALAHRMTTIGGGYVWPNISISSDGEYVEFEAKQSKQICTDSLHYIVESKMFTSARNFEDAVDLFIEQVIRQLCEKKLIDTNLNKIWRYVQQERKDPKQSKYRQLEALMGFDPDEAPIETIESLISESKTLGTHAIEEIAAGDKIMSAEEFKDLARTRGVDVSPENAVTPLAVDSLLDSRSSLPWERGVHAAVQIRRIVGLEANPMDNLQLANIAGVLSTAITENTPPAPYGLKTGFALNISKASRRIVLLTRREESRRFELARLIGDRVASGIDERLTPTSSSFTYRQKMQRAFAGELLCPFESLQDKLDGDFTDEAIGEAADYYNVSALVIKNHLVHKNLLPRNELVME